MIVGFVVVTYVLTFFPCTSPRFFNPWKGGAFLFPNLGTHCLIAPPEKRTHSSFPNLGISRVGIHGLYFFFLLALPENAVV